MKEDEREYNVAEYNEKLEAVNKEQQNLNNNRDRVAKQLSAVDEKIAQKDSIITVLSIEREKYLPKDEY